jgi:hypothetical protein
MLRGREEEKKKRKEGSGMIKMTQEIATTSKNEVSQ